MLYSVYIIEQLDHVCSIHYFKPDKERQSMKTLRQSGILWFEKLGVIDHRLRGHENGELLALVKRSSRPMLFFDDPSNHSHSFMSVDHAKKMLAIDSSDYSWMSREDYGNHFSAQFVPISLDADVVQPYGSADWGIAKKITVSLYIQETMIRPICSLSIDSDDDAYAECDWRESLGDVEAVVNEQGVIDVRLRDASHLVRECSRKMLLVSDRMAPKYIPRNWLESAVSNLDFRRSRIENGSAGYLVH